MLEQTMSKGPRAYLFLHPSPRLLKRGEGDPTAPGLKARFSPELPG